MRMSDKFKTGDEVVVVEYPEVGGFVIGSTGTITGWDGRYWNVTLNTNEEDNKYLFESGELELFNTQCKYDPSQAGDQDDDV